ncbi:hypothetical protein K435DRAFT_875441 [Dendrothele bispora CBS 962.96]|uniref:Uncharacterized protein n=1 Tax=Dendrothele bispora (strain CBS 962.96) TaxID=1314807 RepID=A0A4S8KU92_DENBC|nr:hypothetical protein K435DRAFT_875441 [Dendrothele bispora CBS 962.96]
MNLRKEHGETMTMTSNWVITGVNLHSTDNDDDTPTAQAKRQAAIATARMSEKVKAQSKVEEVIEGSQPGAGKRTTCRSTRSTHSDVIEADAIDDNDEQRGHEYGNGDSEL